MDHRLMRSGLSHMQINVDAGNIPFYRELFTFLGWDVLHEDTEGAALGVGGANDESLWFMGGAATKDGKNDYDRVGVNHIAIAAESQADVDTTATFLRDHGVELLFETPRHRPDFAFNEGDTYYQVMFETPDELLLEFVYTGPKQD
jgi:catechol 2,3-dioxygenase-like lactoylglutathione lyase family enzyme